MTSTNNPRQGVAFTMSGNSLVPAKRRILPEPVEEAEVMRKPLADQNTTTLTAHGDRHFRGEETTQVSTDLFNTLLMSLEQLKEEMGLMKGEIATLRSQNTELIQQNRVFENRIAATDGQLRSLLKNSGGDFYLFPKLPKELQAMIWKVALTVPRVIALRLHSENDFVQLIPTAKSRIPDPLLETCRTSREEALEVRARAFFTCVKRDWKEEFPDDEHQLWFDNEADILWFVALDDSDKYSYVWNLSVFVKELHDAEINARIIAFSIHQWVRELSMHVQFLLSQLQDTKEIIIVVGGDELLHNSDVMMAEPQDTPIEVLPQSFFDWREGAHFDEDYLDWQYGEDDGSSELNWGDVEDEAMKYLSLKRKDCEERRERQLATGRSEQEIDELFDKDDMQKCAVTRIRFMVATTNST